MIPRRLLQTTGQIRASSPSKTHINEQRHFKGTSADPRERTFPLARCSILQSRHIAELPPPPPPGWRFPVDAPPHRRRNRRRLGQANAPTPATRLSYYSTLVASSSSFNMAQQQTPTFKLVLVGDGGTGKVRGAAVLRGCRSFGRPGPRRRDLPLMSATMLDYLCQAPLDRRIREEVHGYSRRRGSPPWLHHGELPGSSPMWRSNVLTVCRTMDRFSSTSGIPPARRSLVDCVMAITSTGSVASSCLTSPPASRTRMSPTGTVCTGAHQTRISTWLMSDSQAISCGSAKTSPSFSAVTRLT